MGRPIDADALFDLYEKEYKYSNGEYRLAFDTALCIIAEAETMDVAPVVHGHWVGEGDGYADGEIVYDVWHCSECGYTIDDGTDDRSLLPNYCQDCGAKMDEAELK
jgi:rubrerythrin